MRQKFFSYTRLALVLLTFSAASWQSTVARPVWPGQFFIPIADGEFLAEEILIFEKTRTLKRRIPLDEFGTVATPNSGDEYNAVALLFVGQSVAPCVSILGVFPVIQRSDNRITGQGLGQIFGGVQYQYLTIAKKGLWVSGNITAGLYLPTANLKDPVVGTRSTDFQLATLFGVETPKFHFSLSLVGRVNTRAKYKGFDKITGAPLGTITAPFDLWPQEVLVDDTTLKVPDFSPIAFDFESVRQGASVSYNIALGYKPRFRETGNPSNFFIFLELSGTWQEKLRATVKNPDGSTKFNGKFNPSGGHWIYLGPSLHYEIIPEAQGRLIDHLFVQLGIQAPIYQNLNTGTLTLHPFPGFDIVLPPDAFPPDHIKAIRQSHRDYRILLGIGAGF